MDTTSLKPPGGGGLEDWLEATRVQHWVKNGFCLAPIFFHGAALEMGAWLAVLPIVVCFSLVSSAAYLVNDIVNSEEDRHHPRKKRRPIASGRIAARQARIAVVILATLALGAAWLRYGWGPVVWMLGGYYVLSWLYSFFLRGLPLLDVLFIAVGFVARVAAGAFALQTYDPGAYPTPSLMGCTYFLALLLGFGKRKGEWLLLEKVHSGIGVTRKALRGYTSDLLDVLTGCSALLAGGTYIAYCLNRPDRIPFVFTAVPVLAGLMSYLRLAWRSTVVETPERLFLHSPTLVASVLLWLCMVAALTAIG